MSSTTKIILIGVLAVVLGIIGVAGIGVAKYISMGNQNARLTNLFNAKQVESKTIHSEMWQTVKEIGGVTDAYASKFDSIYSHIMDARYSKGDGSLMKFITEANPTFDSRLYEKLANVIEEKRIKFNGVQKDLLDIDREHNDLITTFPGTLFLSGAPRFKVQIVTSTRSEKAFESGVDDETFQMNGR
jgi:hypothetical protein